MIYLCMDDAPVLRGEDYVELGCNDCTDIGYVRAARLAELKAPLVVIVLCATCYHAREVGGF